MRVLALLILAVLPVNAAERDLQTFECKRPQCLMMTESDLAAIVANNNINYDRAEAAEKRVRELEGGAPKCATLEVVPKPSIPIDPQTQRRS